MLKPSIFFSFVIFLFSCEKNNVNIPQILTFEDGSNVSSIKEWEQKRKPEIIALFENQVYGKTLGKADSMNAIIKSVKPNAIEGKATMEEIELIAYTNGDSILLNLLQYTPNNGAKTHPCFIGLNFWGNQATTADSSIRITNKWMLDYEKPGITNHYATDSSRGFNAHRWPIEMIIDKGYALITCHSADIDTDRENWEDGIHPLFYKKDQAKPDSNEWGTIGAWAWGLSRILDYSEQNNLINHNKVIAIGHSRLGKSCLWAGAQDERFAGVISNNSGCGGAAYSRNKKGETVAMINKTFPHWFCDNFNHYSDNEDNLPVDQHQLLALIAPRPLYVASATKDEWADPEGEFIATKMASEIYSFYGLEELPINTFPLPNTPAIGKIGYHLRDGKHDITSYDWEQYLKWADKYIVNR